jgi:hypothetical protein
MQLPDDLWRVIATFSEDELLGMVRLRLVTKQFARLMRHPSVVSHLHFNFTFLRKVPLVVVDETHSVPHDCLGSLTAGVRSASVHNANSVQSFAWLNNLKRLHLYHSSLDRLPFSLETLSLNWCHINHDVKFPDALCKKFHINYCSSFDMNRVSHMTWLQSLKLKDAGTISSLHFAQPLTSLHELCVSQCRSLVDVSAFLSLRGLKKLTLEDCPQLMDIESLASLTNLDELKLLECHEAKDVQRIVDRLPKLQRLSILHHRLEMLTLAQLPNLTFLCLYDCIRLVDLRELPLGIIDLNLENCYRLADFSELAKLVHLQELNMWHTMISALPNLPSLRTLNVNNCDDLTDDGLLSVRPCPNLHSVLMHNCELLSDHIGDLLIAAPGRGSR